MWWRKAPKAFLVKECDNISYASIADIDSAVWEKYSTCRGQIPKEKQLHRLNLIGAKYDPDNDEQQDAINDGLWDWYCHQYTLYSATPLALNYLLKKIQVKDYCVHKNIVAFVKVVRSQGTGGILLDGEELLRNREGTLPIFKIEDVLELYPQTVSSIVSD